MADEDRAAKVAKTSACADDEEDERFMREAIAQGRLGRVTAPPNPWVGCVLVRDKTVIARGFHPKAGQPHAEVQALQALPGGAASAKGSTAYVTLEPCSHTGRTGPCCVALADAGVARVVVACMDPDERVSGRGVEYLRSKGIIVRSGVAEAEAATSLLPYLTQRRTGRPYVVVKTALTIDGCIACTDGTSQWITGPEARARSHQIRAESQAIIVGSGTALADDPRLTVRACDPMPPSQPLRVLLDRRGRVTKGNLLDVGQAPTLVATTSAAPAATLQAWHNAGVEVDQSSNGDPTAVLELLAKRGVLQVMVEGGAEVHSDFLRRRLCDRLVVFIGATVFGDGKRWLNQGLCSTIKDAAYLKLATVTQLGDDICLEYVPK